LASGLKGGFDVLDRGSDCVFDSLEGVQNVEPKIVSDGF
jgi:hypothetical protein